MTIYDIAKQAGVSTATVSRVINGSDRVSEKTRERIERIMEENHFVANSSAKSLAGKRTRTIGILAESLRNIHFMNAANVIVNYFDSLGYVCVMMPASHSYEKHLEALRVLAERNLDALVLIGSAFMNGEVEEALLNYYQEVPILVINGEIQLPNTINIKADEKKGVYDATEILIQKGRKNLVFVNGRNNAANNSKKEGYIEACEKHGLMNRKLWKINEYGYFEIRDSIKNMLMVYPETDGIIFGDDFIACAGAKAIMEMGKRVPEQLAYFGVNNDQYSYMANPQLSSIDNYIQELAEIGCNLLVGMFRKGAKAPVETLVKACEIVERETT